MLPLGTMLRILAKSVRHQEVNPCSEVSGSFDFGPSYCASQMPYRCPNDSKRATWYQIPGTEHAEVSNIPASPETSLGCLVLISMTSRSCMQDAGFPNPEMRSCRLEMRRIVVPFCFQPLQSTVVRLHVISCVITECYVYVLMWRLLRNLDLPT